MNGLQQQNSAMTHSEEKEMIREALSKAQRKGLKITAVAEALGMEKPQSLSQFLSKGHLGIEHVRALKAYLQDNGLLHDDRERTSRIEPLDAFKEKFRLLLRVMDSPAFSDEFKLAELTATVQVLYNHLDSIRNALNESVKAGNESKPKSIHDTTS